VLRCCNIDTHQTFAIKVVKIRPKYVKQITLEHKILEDVCYLLFIFFFLMFADLLV
jgi:hypothetical protein